MRVWTRAVIGPAARRFQGVFVGICMVAAVIFGPTAMQPSDLTGLARHDAGVAAVLVATWVLLFLPTARVLLRAEGGRFLRSLPHPPRAPMVLAVTALVILQAPWLALWWFGEGPLGLAVVAVVTLPILLLAVIDAPVVRPRVPRWRSNGAAVRGIYVRAVTRRAIDAALRAAGLAILAGIAGGLLVRNNQLDGAEAATIGTSVMAVILIPVRAGMLIVLVEAHRQSAWLVATTGISPATRVVALATVIAGIDLLATAIALGAYAIAFGANGYVAATSGLVAIATALGSTRAVIAAAPSVRASTRVVVGAVSVAALCILALGMLGMPGAIAAIAITAFALLGQPPC